MSSADSNPAKAGPSHPPYLTMIKDAIVDIGNKKGSSRLMSFFQLKHLYASTRLPLPSTCWPSTLTARGVGPTCAQPLGQDWHRRRSSWPEKMVGSLKCFGCELSIGKGAGSYKIAKAVAEKSKEKVVVAKKVEIPKKAVKKVAEGNFEFNDYGCIVSKAKLRTRKLHRRRRRRARPAVAKAQRGQRLKRL